MIRGSTLHFRGNLCHGGADISHIHGIIPPEPYFWGCESGILPPGSYFWGCEGPVLIYSPTHTKPLSHTSTYPTLRAGGSAPFRPPLFMSSSSRVSACCTNAFSSGGSQEGLGKSTEPAGIKVRRCLQKVHPGPCGCLRRCQNPEKTDIPKKSTWGCASQCVFFVHNSGFRNSVAQYFVAKRMKLFDYLVTLLSSSVSASCANASVFVTGLERKLVKSVDAAAFPSMGGRSERWSVERQFLGRGVAFSSFRRSP